MIISPKVSLVGGLIVAFFIGFIFGNNFERGGGRLSGWKGDHRGGKMMMHDQKSESMEDMMKHMPAGLSGKTGDDFDKAFLKVMIMHHEGAVIMANQVLAVSKRAELQKLAKDMVSAQTKEIEMMKTWFGTWFGESATTSGDMNHKGMQGEVACTMEAKICPDGSYVGRTGPKCEFAPCPTK